MASPTVVQKLRKSYNVLLCSLQLYDLCFKKGLSDRVVLFRQLSLCRYVCSDKIIKKSFRVNKINEIEYGPRLAKNSKTKKEFTNCYSLAKTKPDCTKAREVNASHTGIGLNFTPNETEENEYEMDPFEYENFIISYSKVKKKKIVEYEFDERNCKLRAKEVENVDHDLMLGEEVNLSITDQIVCNLAESLDGKKRRKSQKKLKPAPSRTGLNKKDLAKLKNNELIKLRIKTMVALAKKWNCWVWPDEPLTAEPTSKQIKEESMARVNYKKFSHDAIKNSFLDPKHDEPAESFSSIQKDSRWKNWLISYPLYSQCNSCADFQDKLNFAHGNDKLPSVSTILKESASDESKDKLIAWESSMIVQYGRDEFEKMKLRRLEVGRELHNCIEKYFENNLEPLLDISADVCGYWKSIEHILGTLGSAVFQEKYICHVELGYMGKFDCIATSENEHVLIEWKTSGKRKSNIADTYDAPLQLAAYLGGIAVDPAFSLNIKKALIVIGYENGTPGHVHKLSQDDCHEYWRRWTHRLADYWESRF